MKHILAVLALSLACGSLGVAKSKTASAKRKVASASSPQQAAERIVKVLYGEQNDPVRSQATGQNTVEVTIGDGSSMNGAAIYRVEFKMLNLTGAQKENEQVADIRITYLGAN